jgi:hypothetical protein
MTDQNETLAAFSQQLASLAYPGMTIIYPDKPVVPLPPLPLVFLELVPTGTTDPTLRGGAETDSGYAMISATTTGNDFGRESNALAKLIKALFPYASRLVVGSTTVLINRPPEVLQGYDDGFGWRVPTRITYQAN